MFWSNRLMNCCIGFDILMKSTSCKDSTHKTFCKYKPLTGLLQINVSNKFIFLAEHMRNWASMKHRLVLRSVSVTKWRRIRGWKENFLPGYKPRFDLTN
jgi:hypothetical protein